MDLFDLPLSVVYQDTMSDAEPVVSLGELIVTVLCDRSNRALSARHHHVRPRRGRAARAEWRGQSTMIKSLLGFVVPTQGRMRVLGLDVATSPLEFARIGLCRRTIRTFPSERGCRLSATAANWPDYRARTRSSARTRCCFTWASARRDTGTSTRIEPA